ncbi:hypothetical protein R3P38DRAFT_2854215 [Favolaschia claudopus]|uniref:Uncharacterized protein n=1 Tax=Favolaschia claudopus TaxID=2862362 RepID=A0AAW0DR33_9AGAR
MASDPDTSQAPPLRDATNLPPSSPDPSIPEMEKEIASLKSLVDAFSRRRGRGGRPKRVRSVDESSDAADPKRSKTSNEAADKTTPDYYAYGQAIGRFLGVHVVLSRVVEYGCHMDIALSEDEGDHDERLEGAWKILCGKFPGFHEYLLELSRDPTTRRAVVKQMTLGMDSVRSADTSTCKKGVALWLLEDPTAALDPPLASVKDKTHRGLAHPAFARALTPMDWEATDSVWQQVLEGERQLLSDQLPRFIFPCSQEFPVGKPLDDPAWGAVLEHACKGEVCLRSAKAIFMGPDAALEGDGYHKGKPGNASIIGMKTFTPRIIAGVITQVRFALSSRQDWIKLDGDFDYEEFFWTIYGLFDDQDLADNIIALWNKVVFGAAKARVAAPAITGGRSSLAQIKAARASQKAAVTAPTPAPDDAAAAPVTVAPA